MFEGIVDYSLGCGFVRDAGSAGWILIDRGLTTGSGIEVIKSMFTFFDEFLVNRVGLKVVVLL